MDRHACYGWLLARKCLSQVNRKCRDYNCYTDSCYRNTGDNVIQKASPCEIGLLFFPHRIRCPDNYRGNSPAEKFSAISAVFEIRDHLRENAFEALDQKPNPTL